MNSKESGKFLSQDYEFKILINYDEVDNLKNSLKSTQNKKSIISKCQWIISKANPKAIVIKIIENKQAIIINEPIVSLSFDSSFNNNDDDIKVTLCIKDIIEALEDKYLAAQTERDKIIFIFKLEEGEVIIEQTQKCLECIIKDMSRLQIYNDDIDFVNEIQSEEDWSFRVINNSLFTQLIKTISDAHNPFENYFIIRSINKSTINLMFYFGNSNEESPEYYCESLFDVRLIKKNQKINPGVGIKYRTKEIADFFYKYDNRKNTITISIDTRLILTIEILKEKSPFKIQKSFAPIIIS